MYVYTSIDRFPLPLPVPAAPQKSAQNGAAAELCRGRDLCRFPAAVEIYAVLLPVLKGGAERCGGPTCATL